MPPSNADDVNVVHTMMCLIHRLNSFTVRGQHPAPVQCIGCIMYIRVVISAAMLFENFVMRQSCGSVSVSIPFPV